MTTAVQPTFATTGRGPNWGAPETRVGTGSTTDSPLKVWNGSEWVSTGVTVSD